MNQIIFLEGNLVHLRPLESSDLTSEYVQWLNDWEVCRYNSHAVFPYTAEKMQAYYQELQSSGQKQVVLAMISKDKQKHIGNISLQQIDWISRSAEFAILLGDKAYWNKGLAFEAASLIFDYGFIRLNLNRIHCGTSADNAGMQKLALKLKMKQEGQRRQAMYKNGAYSDILEYGLLKEEFYH